jgi:hypothetical protein
MNRTITMAKYPRDQFDDIPVDLARVGVHRAPARRGRGWITFAWAALFTGLFVAGGYFGLGAFRGLSFTAEPSSFATPSASVTVEPVLDPALIDPERAITITILNGTTTVGLEKIAATSLVGWPVGARLTADNRNEERTVIYYSNPADEDVARGLALALGAGEIRESSAYLGASVTIVLGADYTGPVAEEETPAP